jgi:carboxyl-terminal processing protease
MADPNRTGVMHRFPSLATAAATALLLLTALPWALADTAAARSKAAPAADEALKSTPELPAFKPLQPLDIHPRTSLTIVEQLRHNHYVSKPLDDNASSEIFDKYLKTLDEGRAYFLASDITELERHRYRLDDALKRGDLAPAFEIFNRFQQRQVEVLQYMLDLLAAGADHLDLNSGMQLAMDRSEAAWPADRAELHGLWRKRLKAAVLTMRLNDRELTEIQELLTRRYQNRLTQAVQTKSEDAFQMYINAFASTYDPHTQYLSPRSSENFNINMSLSLEGIGAVLRTEDEYTEIVRLVPAGPADRSGQLRPADRITGVGQGETGKIIDVVGWRLDDVVELIRGPKNSTVRLEVIPAGSESETRIVNVIRDSVRLEEQSAQKKVMTLEHEGMERQVGIIKIPTFYADFRAMQQGDPDFKSTTRDVRRLIEELREEGIQGLVIDLRNNGGGSLQEADSLTGLFIESGPTVQVKTAHRRANVYADTNGDVAWDGPLVVLVNRLSASASEIFAGAIQDYGRGLIVGSQTFGKGTVQSLIPLNRGQLKITQAKFYRISGKSTQHQGVIPDVLFPEIYDVERIGESALSDALAWDVIQPVVFQPFADVQPQIDTLRDWHRQRIVRDPEFQYYEALATRTREERARSHLSLNEAERRRQKAEEEAWRVQLENKRRAAKGEAPVASLEEIEKELADAEADADAAARVEIDGMLRESGHILLDYMGLTEQFAKGRRGDGLAAGSDPKRAAAAGR